MKDKAFPNNNRKTEVEQCCLDEAIRLYEVIISITEKGCDAEVKRVKGKLKVQMIKKSESVFLN